MWNIFIERELKITTSNTSAGVVAKTRNPELAQIPSKILNSLTCDKYLSLKDLHGKA